MSETIWEGIRINIKATNMELTEEIHDYIEKRVTKLGTWLSKQSADIFVYFEVAKTTEHHQQGMIYHADCRIDMAGKTFYASDDAEDIKIAIDSVKDKLFREVRKSKGKENSLFRRGSARIKKMLKFGK